MKKLSLIQTSQNRKDELERFVKSLNNQVGIDLNQIQLIFVDQEDNKQVFNGLDERIDFVYIKYHHCSLSHARNIGLKYVTGDYVGFPDDDCWYESNTLLQVIKMFSDGYVGVIAKGTDEKRKLTNDFPQSGRLITKYNHCGAISYTIFIKFISKINFDENIGVGSPYGLCSGEETDYLLNVMSVIGTNIYYNPKVEVHHPSNKIGNFEDENHKQYLYARGWGYILRKHNYPLSIVLKSLLRPLGGMLISFFRINKKSFVHSFYLFRGRLEGYIFNINVDGKN